MSAPYYADDQVTVHAGDCLDVMAELADECVDAVVTDPPYGLEFMGKDWDRFSGAVTDRGFKGFVLSQQRTRNVKCPECGKWAYDHPGRLCECGGVRRAQGSQFQQWCELWAAECLRLLKPGGHLVSFGGSRTWHRLAAAIEDAGFEIRDSIAWLYGSGFPKSMDVSKAIDKAAGAERDIVGAGPFAARRPRADYASQGLTYADDAYVRPAGHEITAPATDAAKQWQGWGTALKPAFEPIVVARKPLSGTVAQTVMAHGTGALNIDACRVEMGGEYDPSKRQRQQRSGGAVKFASEGLIGTDIPTYNPAGRWPTNVVIDAHTAAGIDEQSGNVKAGGSKDNRGRRNWAGTNDSRLSVRDDTFNSYDDEGGASRFFPTFRYEAKAPTAERPSVDGAAHPTVKPLDLMRWLVRLITPPHGLVLDPFAGSGTTAEACIHEHMRCITIEREPDYLPLIVGRLSKPMAIGFDFREGA